MLCEHEALTRAWPGIVEGVDLIGSEQIQGRASLAGNLCNASPAADSVPAMIAARATCVIAGPDGKREAPVEAIVTGPGRTSLAKGEFIVEFHVPKPKPHQSDAYLRFIPRTEMDIAVVGCGVNVTLDASGVCTDARVVLGAVAPTQIICDEAAKALIGHRLDDADAWPRSTPRRGVPATRSTTSAAPSNTAPRSPACSRAARPPLPLNALGAR